MADVPEKGYLGDGAYVAFEWPGFKLTAENGIRATDTVFLEPDAIVELIRYVAPIVSPGIRRRIAEAVKP